MREHETARLQRENEELREEVRQLRALLLPEMPIPDEWGLVNREKQVLRTLLDSDLVSQERMFFALYGAESDTDPNVVQSHVSKMRSKVRPFGLVIVTKRYEGYALQNRREWKEKIMAWWKNASTDERMAQVEGGLECSMTAAQIATASRTTRQEVIAFGEEHGLRFRERRGANQPKKPPSPIFDRAQVREPGADEFQMDDALEGWAAS